MFLSPYDLFRHNYVTHHDKGPVFSFEFEQATITYSEVSNDIIATDRTGKEKHYGSTFIIDIVYLINSLYVFTIKIVCR